MAKRIITYTLVAEMEIDTKWYDETSDTEIKKFELANAKGWVFDNIKNEKITIKKA